MFRRLQSTGLPGADDSAPTTSSTMFWDFRRETEDQPWTLELQAWASGAWRTPAQADWLAAQGLPVPPPHGAVALAPDQLDRLTSLLAPVCAVSWQALALHEEAVQAHNRGRAHEALAKAEQLMGIAPAWEDARLLQLTLLIQVERDADRAEAALHDLPAGLVAPAQLRALRQSIALLRDDWPAYAAEVRATIDEGDTSWWHFEVLGLSLWAAQELGAARAAFEEGLALHPDHRDLQLRWAEVVAAAGDPEAALARLDRMLADPRPEGPRAHAKTWALRGWLRRERAPEAARADVAAALDRDPEEPVARVCRGLWRMAAGDVAGARADLAPFSHCGWAEAAAAWNAFVAAHGTPDDHPNRHLDGAAADDPSHSHSHSHSHHHGEAPGSTCGHCP